MGFSSGGGTSVVLQFRLTFGMTDFDFDAKYMYVGGGV